MSAVRVRRKPSPKRLLGIDARVLDAVPAIAQLFDRDFSVILRVFHAQNAKVHALRVSRFLKQHGSPSPI